MYHMGTNHHLEQRSTWQQQYVGAPRKEVQRTSRGMSICSLHRDDTLLSALGREHAAAAGTGTRRTRWPVVCVLAKTQRRPERGPCGGGKEVMPLVVMTTWGVDLSSGAQGGGVQRRRRRMGARGVWQWLRT